ncbi:Helix-turn-helix [Flaviramulus basaltis]|uniref:Helix-turn-helix n=1 Tax=Flaviramulus basaltis TaxID=369401 RepID=A0A1K2IB78_9FLAO|nr:helix-turn-helix transcriptional regulator [Flaviramulus basaltis]SFZ89530.1 Helix-turn-helix [Flaviramulus basaltis]
MEEEAKKQMLKAFGSNLKKIRKERGFSYRELAQLCDVDHSQISKIEKGLISIQITTLVELSKGLEIHPKELLDFDFKLGHNN